MPPFIMPGSAEYRRTNVALFFAGFATFSLLYCVQPLLPVLAEEFAVTPAVSSLALSMTTGALAFAIVFAGPLSQAAGRRGLMALSIALASLCNVLAAFAGDWHSLLGLRMLEGVALGGVPAVVIAYLGEEIEPGGLGRATGLYVASSALGGLAGRSLTGFLSEEMGWRFAIGAIGGLGVLFAVGFALLLPPSRHFRKGPWFDPGLHLRIWLRHILHPRLPLLFVIGGLAMGGFVTVYNYIGFRLQAPPYDLNQTQTGLIFIVYLIGMLTSYGGGHLADRIGRAPVLVAGLLVAVTGLVVTLFQPLAVVVLGVALLTGGFFAAHAVASGWIGGMAIDAKGHAASLYLLVYYLGSSVLGSAGGWFWSFAGWPGVVAFTGAAYGLALAAAIMLRRTA